MVKARRGLAMVFAILLKPQAARFLPKPAAWIQTN
jgi:hypothetical protein